MRYFLNVMPYVELDEHEKWMAIRKSHKDTTFKYIIRRFEIAADGSVRTSTIIEIQRTRSVDEREINWC